MAENSKFYNTPVGANYILSCDHAENVSKPHSKLMVLKLFFKSDMQTPLATKNFVWPEKILPDVNYGNGYVALKGKRNTAMIPFRLPRIPAHLPKKEGDFLLDQEFIRNFLNSCAPFLVDEHYVKVLRFCAEQEDYELFDLLLEKSFTPSFLFKHLETLDGQHVAKILEMGKEKIVSSVNNSDKSKRALDLMSFLLDSFAHKLLWDDSNLPVLTSIRSMLNEMVQLLSSYTNLCSAKEAKKQLSSLSTGQLTDYQVRRVYLKSKYVE